MFDQRRDFDRFTFLQSHLVIFKSDLPFALENIKELPRRAVIMHYLRATRRDAFLDHTDVIAFEEMPAVANLTPYIMFGVFNGNYHKLGTSLANDLQHAATLRS